MTKNDSKFVVCLHNKGFEASLSIRKLYRVLSDPSAETASLIRVVDESGEDYLYPQNYFASVEMPEEAAAALAGSKPR